MAVLLCVACTSFAGLASPPSSSEHSQRADSMEGVYAGLGVGGARLIFDFGNLLGYTVEGRLGYSFNPVLQLYLSGSIDGELPPIGFRSELIAVFVQYHLYSEPSLGVVARAGIGVALSSSFSTGNNMGPGAAGGLGLEIGLSPGLFLTPELFYKYQSLSPTNGTSAATGEQIVGLQLSLSFY